MLYAVLIMFGLALMYGILFGANASTPVPKGCQAPLTDCHSCSVDSCNVGKE